MLRRTYLFLLICLTIFGPVTSAYSAQVQCAQLFSLEKTQGELLFEKTAEKNKSEWRAHNIHPEKMIKAIFEIAKRDPLMAKLVNVIHSKQYTFAMDRSTSHRLDILNSNRFLNQHETESSAGAYNPEQRAHLEAEYLGLTKAQYAKLPNAIKPKSAYMIPLKESGIQPEATLYTHVLGEKGIEKHQGDTWVFDLPKIEKQMGFVVGDSYDRAIYERDFADDFKNAEISPEAKFKKDHIADYVLGNEYLYLTLPYVYEQVKTHNKWRFVDEESPEYQRQFEEFKEEMGGYIADWQYNIMNSRSPNFNEEYFARFPELKEFEGSYLFRPFGNYVEGLVYGDIQVQGTVKALIWRSRPPSVEERKKLESMGVQIIDGRLQK